MKRRLLGLAIVLCLLWFYGVSYASAADKFEDVPSSPKKIFCYDAVDWAVENSITLGKTKTHFMPTETCTKKQALTFLWRTYEKNKKPEKYAQNSGSQDLEDAVRWAQNIGLETGDVNVPCTRADFVEYLYMLSGKPFVDINKIESTFSDVFQTSKFARAVMWAVKNGITNGYPDGSFGPDIQCNRGQIVTFLYRFMNEEQ